MVFDSTPLTEEIVGVVAEHWRLPVVEGQRLHGGEESSAYRLGDVVVRIGPEWRTDEELEWAHTVAARAASTLPEAVAPISTSVRSTVVRVEGRPISVWPFRAGTWPDDDDDLTDQAADLLARMHRALREINMPPRPGRGPTLVPTPDLVDEDLDRWLADFETRCVLRQPLHGDFYGGNTLVNERRLTTILDWDEAFIGPPERELAFAAWEWGDGLDTLDLTEAFDFIGTYIEAGGVVDAIDEVTLRQFVRERIRREVAYARAAPIRGVILDDDDRGYETRQLEAFEAMRP